MFDTQQDLLNAIIANPDDDAPRLIYADWLDDNAKVLECRVCKGAKGWFVDVGHSEFVECSTCNATGLVSNGYAERAEFIRLQCKNTLLDKSNREIYLGHNNRVHWFEADNTWDFSITSCRNSSDKPSRQKIVRRGFIDEIHLTTDEFMKHCHEIAAQHPVRKWVLMDFKPSYSDLIQQFTIWDSDYFGNRPSADGDVRRPIFKRLKGGDSSSKIRRGYATEQELFADLEQACFHHARSKLEFI